MLLFYSNFSFIPFISYVDSYTVSIKSYYTGYCSFCSSIAATFDLPATWCAPRVPWSSLATLFEMLSLSIRSWSKFMMLLAYVDTVHIISTQFLFTVVCTQAPLQYRQMMAQAIRKSVYSEFSNLKYQTSGFIENLVNSSLYMLWARFLCDLVCGILVLWIVRKTCYKQWWMAQEWIHTAKVEPLNEVNDYKCECKRLERHLNSLQHWRCNFEKWVNTENQTEPSNTEWKWWQHTLLSAQMMPASLK